MKKTTRYLNYIILFMFCLVVGGGLVGSSVFADVSNFYFSDFTGDYYLSRDEDGTSRLKVKESVTAVFPNFNQNKGICRQIPFTNQNGANITLPNLTSQNIKVTRNGVSEPIYSIEKGKDYYSVCTGTEEYVLGEQIYTFEYEFTKVVTEFDQDGRKFQELYWDTNGNGSLQRFDSVTARVHFEDPEVFAGDSWCYVGKYGKSGKDRCEITTISDGVQFVTKNLMSEENLTFDVELKAGSFVVPEVEKNYVYVWILVGFGVVCVMCIGFALRKYLKTREKKTYYKGIFVKPEYQPNANYGLTEMAEIYLGKKKDMKVAMLLEMIVQRKIELKKDGKKWDIVVKESVSDEYEDLLAILNGGNRPAVGDTIKLERYSATSRLVALKKAMENKILENLKKDELVEDKYVVGSSGRSGLASMITRIIIAVPMMIFVGFYLVEVIGDLCSTAGYLVFYEYFNLVFLVMIAVTTVLVVVITEMAKKYAKHTKKGLEASRYMDGLRLYIGMAEAERMKMLQSVKGADVSADGIVKLYEKLLPYAAVFGLEESWMNEMKQYCKVEEIEEPDYLMQGFATSEIVRGLNRASSYATTSTVMSSSGGGSSSGFSGGGGGGFSGGGGGGGGFGGR